MLFSYHAYVATMHLAYKVTHGLDTSWSQSGNEQLAFL